MSKSKILVPAALVLAAALSTTFILADQDHDHDHGKQAKHEAQGDPYLLDTDPVSGKELGALKDQVVLRHEGRELRFAGEKTARTFRSDPTRYLAQVDQELVRQQSPFYPLKTCVVSGQKLGEMGEPIDLIHGNRLVRFCCKGCVPKFQRAPDEYLAVLDEAVVASQLSKYSLKTCVVSGEELGGEMGDPIDYVIGNRLVRLCCKGCKRKVAKDPLKYLAKLDGASSPEHGRDAEQHDHDHGHGD